MSIPEYTHLKIVGDISVEPVTCKELPDDAIMYTLLGPTGAGKSCFIQALAGDSQDLGISKDQLAGFTQKASAYKLVNVLFQVEGKDMPIYLIDTPGFSDPKISSLGVFESQSTIYEETSYSKTLFLTPVTDTRMAGSKRRTIDLLTTWFQPSKYHTAFTIVTTMWNTLHTERAHQHAEEHYEQLRGDIFKEFSDTGATIARFDNTRSSALSILDMEPWLDEGEANVEGGRACLYRDLYERIKGALQQKGVIQSELAHPEAQTNPDLEALLKKNLTENEETLKTFVKEFLTPDIGFPPAGFEDAHYRLLKSLLGTYIPLTISMRSYILQYHLTRLVRNTKRRGSKLFKLKA